MTAVTLFPTIVMVTHQPTWTLPNLPTGHPWIPTENLADRAVSARVKWNRSHSSLRFSPTTFNLTLDVSDRAFPETTATLANLLRSEIYLAIQADTHPVVIFQGWVTSAKWARSDGQYLLLHITAQDALGHLQNLKSDLSAAPGVGTSSFNWWSAHRWLAEAAKTSHANPNQRNRLRALFRGLWWASASNWEGPRLAPQEDYFDTQEPRLDNNGNEIIQNGQVVMDPIIMDYSRVLQEIRHQTQGRIGIAHGWYAQYPHPGGNTAFDTLPVWGTALEGETTRIDATTFPMPSYLGAQYVGELNNPMTAFVTATAASGGDVLFSEKTGYADTNLKPQYRGYGWAISNEPSFAGGAEPAAQTKPTLVNEFQRGGVGLTHRPVPTGFDYFVGLDTEGNDFLTSAQNDTYTSMSNTQYIYSWSNWLAFSERSPRLSYRKMKVPVHFVETPRLADAILLTNLWTKLRVRMGGRSSELLDRTYRVDGVEWNLFTLAGPGCGLDLRLDLLELKQETSMTLNHQRNPAYQTWNQSALNNGNVLG